MLQLAYPREVDAQDPRREKRLDCNFPGTLIADGRPYRCLVQDLAPSGARVRCSSQPTWPVQPISSIGCVLAFMPSQTYRVAAVPAADP